MSLTTCAELLIRPPRMEYKLEDLDGPYFHVNGKPCSRLDRTITNKRGHKLEVSFYEPCVTNGPNPCVIYCHGKGGSRISGRNASLFLLQAGLSVCLFDFAGCGKSEGDYITMGHHEIDDIHAVVEFVKSTNKVASIGLWGRSMGAAAALMYAEKYPKNAQCLILDSLYHNLTKMIVEWLNTTRRIPKCALWTFLRLVNWKIRKLTGADLYNINPIDSAPNVTIPAIFAVGKEDTITLPRYIEQVYNLYAGHKELVQFTGEHDTSRPESFFSHACEFARVSLRPPLTPVQSPSPVANVIPEVPVIPEIPPIRSHSTNVDRLVSLQSPVHEELEAANPVSPPISSPRTSEVHVPTLPPLPPQEEPENEPVFQEHQDAELPLEEEGQKGKDDEQEVLVIHEDITVAVQQDNVEKETPRTSQEYEVTQPIDSAKHEVKRDRIWSDAATGTSSITSPAELMQQLASITKAPLASPNALSTRQVPLTLLVNQPPEVYKPPHRIFD